jgi:A/G-specific adenine glycosylase
VTASSQLGALIVRHFGEIRRDLPWRRSRDPYAIWVSEIMLQQTRVATVIPYWERWMARFPSVAALAAAPLDDVLAAWAGLGYYSRARNLHRGAQEIRDGHGGDLPGSAAGLRAVPGIGPYTAGAIASIAYGERAPLVDGNVARVLARVVPIELDVKSSAGQKALWAEAGALMAALAAGAAPGELNQGLMELGATVCAPTSPRCLTCPLGVARLCATARDGRQEELPIMPRRKRQAELPELALTALWCEQDGVIVVARRRPDGLFGGLWELPSDEDPRALGRRLAIAKIEREPVALHDQVLTHRRLRVVVVRAGWPGRLGKVEDPSYDEVAAVPIAAVASLGIAAATRAILGKHKDAPWTATPGPRPSSPRATRRSWRASASSVTTSTTPTSPRPPRGRPRASTSLSTTRPRSRAR